MNGADAAPPRISVEVKLRSAPLARRLELEIVARRAFATISALSFLASQSKYKRIENTLVNGASHLISIPVNMMGRFPTFLAWFLVVPSVSAFHNFNPNYSPAPTERDVTPLYNGLPPEGIDPLALGFYATTEVIDPVELEIEGEIPSWISGSLYRGAQGTWDVNNFTSEHWFDGFSRQHRFEIENGKVSYRSRNGSDGVQDCEFTLACTKMFNNISSR